MNKLYFDIAGEMAATNNVAELTGVYSLRKFELIENSPERIALQEEFSRLLPVKEKWENEVNKMIKGIHKRRRFTQKHARHTVGSKTSMLDRGWVPNYDQHYLVGAWNWVGTKEKACVS